LNGRALACDEVLSLKLEVVFEMRRHRRDGGDGCMMEAGGALIGCCFEGASFLSLSRFSTFSHSAIQPSRMAERKPRHNQTEEAGIGQGPWG
jgi:hypothetical protein